MRRPPHFIGIGTPKAGTSWLASHIDDHPELAVPVKETHFFSRGDQFALGRDHYESHFMAASPKEKAGEFSPNYLGNYSAAERIHAWYPDVRLLAILRNPIQRAFSHYAHELRAGQAHLEDGFIANSRMRHEYLHHGYYARLLARYYEHFDRSQLLVLVYEEVIANPAEAIRRTYEHLGVDPSHQIHEPHRRVNGSRVPRSQWVERAYDRVKQELSGPTLKPLRTALLQAGLPAMVRRLNTSAKTEQALRPTEAEREFLLRTYAGDVKRLGELLGRSFDVWPEFG